MSSSKFNIFVFLSMLLFGPNKVFGTFLLLMGLGWGLKQCEDKILLEDFHEPSESYNYLEHQDLEKASKLEKHIEKTSCGDTIWVKNKNRVEGTYVVSIEFALVKDVPCSPYLVITSPDTCFLAYREGDVRAPKKYGVPGYIFIKDYIVEKTDNLYRIKIPGSECVGYPVGILASYQGADIVFKQHALPTITIEQTKEQMKNIRQTFDYFKALGGNTFY